MKNEMKQSVSSISISSREQNESKKSSKRSVTSKMLAWAGIGLCDLCCALPFVGAIAGITFFTAIAVYLEMMGILAIGLAGIFFAYAYYQKNQKKKQPTSSCETSCDVDCGCSTEVALKENTYHKNFELI